MNVLRAGFIIAIIYAIVLLTNRHEGIWPQVLAIGIGIIAVNSIRSTADHARKWLDKRFFREQLRTEELLGSLANDVHRIMRTDELVQTMAQRIASALHVERITVWLTNTGGLVPAYAANADGWDATPMLADLRDRRKAVGPEKVRKQWASLEGWNCKPEEVDVAIWLPAGFKTANDPDGVQEFRIRISDLDAADVADLIGINLMKDAQGAALAEAFIAVTQEGWSDGGPFKPAKPDYTFSDLIDYLEYLRQQQTNSDHPPATLRALIRSLRALERQPVFSGAGTPMTELLKAGRLSVLMLPLRIGDDLRRVVTRLLIRRILREREQASQIRQRLDVETLDERSRARLEEELANRMPRSILALDEAQELIGEDGGEARQALENFCLLGRNYGLSLILATQRPLASAISSKIRSQVDLQIIHRLLTQDDINVSQANLLALYPREITDGNHDLDFAQLVRSLDRGQAIISASHARARDAVDRIIVARIRPRITVHGGEVS